MAKQWPKPNELDQEKQFDVLSNALLPEARIK